MTKPEFSILAKSMKAVYTYGDFLADNYAMELWFSLLEDIPYKIAAAALKNHMQTSNKMPTPADIRNGAYQLTKADEMTDAEAWGLVSKAISRSGYNYKAEFEKLPESVRRAVGNERQLHEWSQTDIQSVETVIQSQFLRSYRTEVKRAEQRAKMSPDVLALVQKTQKQLGVVK